MPLQMPESHRKAQLHCPGIGRNADDWTVVSANALYGASALQMLESPVSGCRPSLLEPV